jgi:hypothetical protein
MTVGVARAIRFMLAALAHDYAEKKPAALCRQLVSKFQQIIQPTTKCFIRLEFQEYKQIQTRQSKYRSESLIMWHSYSLSFDRRCICEDWRRG